MLSLTALVAIFISLLLSTFLLTVKSQNRLANVLFASFIMLCAIDISGIITGQYFTSKPDLFLFFKSFSFLIFPSFFFYVLAICYKNYTLKLKSLLHVAPFVLYNLLLFCAVLFDENDLIQLIAHKWLWIAVAFLLKLQALLYLIAAIHVLNKYKKIFLENYANGSIAIYSWLLRIVIIFSITLPFTILKEFLLLGNYQLIFSWIIAALTATVLLMLSWFFLKALYSPELFRGIDPQIKPSKKLLNSASESKPLETELDLNSALLVERLSEYMIAKEPFLESTLTLQDLALQINIPARELSFLINQHIGQHFFDFINKYRIEKALEILKKSSSKEYTIQQILYEVGFNSKSSFNTAFKKHTQITPTEYKSQLSQK